MTRVKDPALLDRLHTVWNEHGCAICGDKGRVELHHVKKRSQGGADSVGNIVGLCGAYSKQQHHLKVENHTVTLIDSSGGLGWKDVNTGEWGYLHYPQDFDSGAGVLPTPVSSVEGETSAPVPPTPARVGVPEVAPPGMTVIPPTVSGPVSAGQQSPADRFVYLQQLGKQASKAYLVMAWSLAEVSATAEWRSLGFESFHDYWGENGLGLPSGTVSKMLKVARFYCDEWDSAVGTGASVEKLYLAAGVAVEPSEAIGLAASMPTFELKALAKREPAPEDQPRCAECGQRLPASYEGRKHEARQERVETRKGPFVSDI